MPHSFDPAARRELPNSVRVTGEELLANWFGLFNRTLEAGAEPKDIPWAWIQYAYRGYIALQRVMCPSSAADNRSQMVSASGRPVAAIACRAA